MSGVQTTHPPTSNLVLQPLDYIKSQSHPSRRRLASRPITTRHLILRLSLSEPLPSLIAESGHLGIFPTQTFRVVRRPADMRLVENIRPLRVMFLLFAFVRDYVHEILLAGEEERKSAKPLGTEFNRRRRKKEIFCEMGTNY